jgi:hypothetical protein
MIRKNYAIGATDLAKGCMKGQPAPNAGGQGFIDFEKIPYTGTSAFRANGRAVR